MLDIAQLQQQLELRANPKTKQWWEGYLKQAVPFRGVKMADIRAVLHDWLHGTASHTDVAEEQQMEIALRLIRERYAEDKLAGILLLQEVLLPAGAINCERDVPRFASLFRDGSISDWNTCDWFCVRVLGPLAEREGPACAYTISAWRGANTLWQRRAAGVAFVNLARHGDRNFPGFTTMLLETCAITVQSPERFAQTGTGWVLRELSHAEPERVVQFIEGSIQHFSREGLRYAAEKLPPDTKAWLKQLHTARSR